MSGAVVADRRRRGLVPADWRRRVENATPDFEVRLATRFYHGAFEGLAPGQLREDELADLRAAWGEHVADEALGVLGRAGYGAPQPRASRTKRAHGSRRERRLDGVLGKLPRALALRLPTTANTRRDGRVDGTDRWGDVSCSRTLRPDHLGLVAAAGGLWAQRACEGDRFAECSAGELVQLLTGRRRVGGKDIVWVHRLLAELDTLELTADVTDRDGEGDTSRAHEIPSSPIARVERRIGDRWVAHADYDQAAAAASDVDVAELATAEALPDAGVATIRIHLADWAIAELAHPKRTPVFIHFDVWAHLRPSARRMYAFLQGLGRDGFDDKVAFYLGRPMLFTLGICSRADRAAEIVRHDLTTLWHADERYHGAAATGRGEQYGSGYGQSLFGRSKLPQFRFRVARRASHPREDVPLRRAQPRRPRGLRTLHQQVRKYTKLSARHVRRDSIDPAHAQAAGGVDQARAQVAAIRQSLLEASAPAPPRPGP